VTDIIVCCGVGGTGKTTTAAALGVASALAGHRTVVLTIDPARRLANALGLDHLGNEPTPVHVPGADLPLHALMLDRKGTWDNVVRRFSATSDHAERLLANRYYRTVSTRLTGSHEYMAIEKLYELVESGEWEKVIVDTPPARHVLDFFKAPDRVARVFDQSVLGVFTQPSRGLFAGATRRAVEVIERIAGEFVMGDISEFFKLFADLSQGFRSRAAATATLLRSRQTRYFLVVNANAPERNDVLGFLGTLRSEGMHFAGFLVNRTARRLALPAGGLPDRIDGLEPEAWSSWRDALTALPERHKAQRAAHLEHARALVSAAGGAPAWLVPQLEGGVRDAADLARLARHLPPHPPATL
jgi:anion-transporting  ArsA/GET3 family ATPase